MAKPPDQIKFKPLNQVKEFTAPQLMELYSVSIYYSKVPNRRACSLRFFRFSIHPVGNFSCNKRKIPSGSFFNLLSKEAGRAIFFPNLLVYSGLLVYQGLQSRPILAYSPSCPSKSFDKSPKHNGWICFEWVLTRIFDYKNQVI